MRAILVSYWACKLYSLPVVNQTHHKPKTLRPVGTAVVCTAGPVIQYVKWRTLQKCVIFYRSQDNATTTPEVDRQCWRHWAERRCEARRRASPDQVVVQGTVAQVQLEVGRASACSWHVVWFGVSVCLSVWWTAALLLHLIGTKRWLLCDVEAKILSERRPACQGQ